MIGRAEALAMVREQVPNANLVNHCVAVEAIMEALAERAGLGPADVARWGIAGLLHDLDYARTAQEPELHGLLTVEQLGDRVDDEMAHAILAHAGKAAIETDMDRALRAADPTTGFIVAAALVRPDRSLAAVEVRSLLKRWKEKAFAKGASREQMDGCEALGMSREEFLALSLGAMQARAGELGLG